MSDTAHYLSPSEAAERLGVSAKALRLYEQRDLVAPVRTAVGWRTYGPAQMARAAEIVALRSLGLSLGAIQRALKGKSDGLEPALASHQSVIEEKIKELANTADRVRALRADLAKGEALDSGELARLTTPGNECVAFDLPWPWGGERFELWNIPPLTYITGPLGSGKTRLARAIAENLPDATFLGLERSADGDARIKAGLEANPAQKAGVERALAWLIEDGATASPDLIVLLAALEEEGNGALIIDMVEQGLDQTTQEALMAYLRHHRRSNRPLFLMTRSCSILDLSALGPGEAILFCPANHSPPIRVAPYSGSPGYETVASCLAPPDVRARTDGVIAWRPQTAGNP